MFSFKENVVTALINKAANNMAFIGNYLIFVYVKIFWLVCFLPSLRLKYLSKRGLIKHTCSWRDKLTVLFDFQLLKQDNNKIYKSINYNMAYFKNAKVQLFSDLSLHLQHEVLNHCQRIISIFKLIYERVERYYYRGKVKSGIKTFWTIHNSSQ